MSEVTNDSVFPWLENPQTGLWLGRLKTFQHSIKVLYKSKYGRDKKDARSFVC